MGAMVLVLGLLMLAWFVLPIIGIIDAATKPETAWRSADQSKTAWVLTQAFTGAAGAIAYYLVIKPKLLPQAAGGAFQPLTAPASSPVRSAAGGSAARRGCATTSCDAYGLETPLARCDLCGQLTHAMEPV